MGSWLEHSYVEAEATEQKPRLPTQIIDRVVYCGSRNSQTKTLLILTEKQHKKTQNKQGIKSKQRGMKLRSEVILVTLLVVKQVTLQRVPILVESPFLSSAPESPMENLSLILQLFLVYY